MVSKIWGTLCFVYVRLCVHACTTLKTLDTHIPRRSPDLFNNVKIGLGQLRLKIKHILFYRIVGLQPFGSSDLKQSNEYSIKQPSDF